MASRARGEVLFLTTLLKSNSLGHDRVTDVDHSSGPQKEVSPNSSQSHGVVGCPPFGRCSANVTRITPSHRWKENSIRIYRAILHMALSIPITSD